jgi:hypothetical protein
MALSVQRGIYKFVGIESPQSIDAATGGSAANLSLSTSFAGFDLQAQATAAAPAAVGGLSVRPAAPWWWGSYVAAELARQAAAREALAVSGDVFAAIPAPWAEAEVEAEPARSGELVAVLRMPTVSGDVFVPRLVAIVSHDEPLDDESAALLAAALLLAA